MEELRRILDVRLQRLKDIRRERDRTHSCQLCSSDVSRNRPFRILALEGGGIRGTISTSVLMRLLEKFPNLVDDVDMIAGTSTGAFIGMCLTTGCTPQEVSTQNSRIDDPELLLSSLLLTCP